MLRKMKAWKIKSVAKKSCKSWNIDIIGLLIIRMLI